MFGIKDRLDNLTTDLRQYADLRVEQVKLNTAGALSAVFSRLVTFLLIAILLLAVVILLSAVGIHLLNDVMGYPWGTLSVCGFFALLLVLAVIFRKKLFRRKFDGIFADAFGLSDESALKEQISDNKSQIASQEHLLAASALAAKPHVDWETVSTVIHYISKKMKKLSLFFAGFAVLMTVSCGSQKTTASEESTGPWTVDTIASNVYHIQDCNESNPAGETFDKNGVKTHFNNCSDIYLIVGQSKALLIDLSNKVEWAEDAAEALRGIVRERVGDMEIEITFTHNHGDHTGMLYAFVEEDSVTFALPSVDFEALASKYPEGRYNMYEEGKIFDLGGYRLAAIMVPGHTAGSMVFHLLDTDMLFTGDAIGSGHGVWLFDTDAFIRYVAGFKHLYGYISEGTNGINKDNLKLYGGHFWQKDWFPELGDAVFGTQYVEDMNVLLDQVIAGTALTEPSGLDLKMLDTYFRNGQAIIVWNAAQAQAYAQAHSTANTAE